MTGDIQFIPDLPLSKLDTSCQPPFAPWMGAHFASFFKFMNRILDPEILSADVLIF
jgi:hypothetical protein